MALEVSARSCMLKVSSGFCLSMVSADIYLYLIHSLSFIRSKMGILESGSIYVHPVCWHPQESGSTHIQSQISQPGPMDHRTNAGTVLILCVLMFIYRRGGLLLYE